MADNRKRWVRDNPKGLWRRWLARPATDAQAIRRWSIWVWWTIPRPLGRRIRLVANQLLIPYFSTRDAFRAVQMYGAQVKEQYGTSRLRQFIGALRLRWKSGLEPLYYYRYRLFLPEGEAASDDFIAPTHDLIQVFVQRRADIDKWNMLVKDKIGFRNWCEANGIPSVPTLLEINGSHITSGDQVLPAQDLFLKPVDWRLGMGVEMLRHEVTGDGSTWKGSDRVARAKPALMEYLAERSRQLARPMVLQPRLINHPEIRSLGNGALCTLRMMTLQPPGGEPLFFLGFLRIARGSAEADNFYHGSLVAPVDAATGILQKALARLGPRIERPIAINPDNGAAIEGTTIPFWERAVQLVLQTHREHPVQPLLVGWDVAILEDGPILIEGNGMPCHQIPQISAANPLGRTALARIIRESLEAEFAIHPTGGARPSAEQKLPAA